MTQTIMKKGIFTLVRLALTLACWTLTAMPAYAGQVSLAWDASPSAEVVGYRLHYQAGSDTLPFTGTGADQGNSPVDVGGTLTTSLTGLTEGQSYYFTVTAYDAAGNESPISNIISVQVPVLIPVNSAPVLAAIGARSVSENSTLSFALSATDTEGDPLVFSAGGLPSGATFNAATRTFSWTPSFEQAGTYALTFSVSDGELSDSETVTITVLDSNRAPFISGTPATSAKEGSLYAFMPTAEDQDVEDRLTFSIANKPAWAAFDSATGTLQGTPGSQDVQTFAAIVISVSDGQASASLPAFSISVAANGPQDSDGDGVVDAEDAFPEDPTESVDTDQDGIGNNADSDDDNDGVADSQDAFPLESARTDWVVTATALEGGIISPTGEVEIAYGSEQKFVILPQKGFMIADVLVDGESQGPLPEYRFSAVQQHHQIQAEFAAIPDGLSLSTDSAELPGVDRTDGGSALDNLIDGVPTAELQYRFNIVLRDSLGGADLDVLLVLNGSPYLMNQAQGDVVTGAVFSRTLELGPAPDHRFHFEVRDSRNDLVWAYPSAGELAGPTIELLPGVNVVGIPKNIDGAALTAAQAFATNQAYRWISKGVTSTSNDGSYSPINSANPAKVGEGVFIKKTASSALPDFSAFADIETATFTQPLQAGWNLISNPYQGQIVLEDILVQAGGEPPIAWLDAAARHLVANALYRYKGTDTYAFISAGTPEKAAMVPWIGYWIYVSEPNTPVTLIIPRPGRS